VRERDGDRCAFVLRDGGRCSERRGLEFHHCDPYGRGGTHDPANVCLLCRQHNAYLAESEYGKGRIDQYRQRDWSPRAPDGESRVMPMPPLA
jgi:hypothetical protein